MFWADLVSASGFFWAVNCGTVFRFIKVKIGRRIRVGGGDEFQGEDDGFEREDEDVDSGAPSEKIGASSFGLTVGHADASCIGEELDSGDVEYGYDGFLFTSRCGVVEDSRLSGDVERHFGGGVVTTRLRFAGGGSSYSEGCRWRA